MKTIEEGRQLLSKLFEQVEGLEAMAQAEPDITLEGTVLVALFDMQVLLLDTLLDLKELLLRERER